MVKLRRIAASTLAIAIAFTLGAAVVSIAQDNNPAEAGATQMSALPAAQIPSAVSDAVNAPGRPAADRALDAGRKPGQLMAFFGIAPGMKVADLFAGTGYTTEILARIVGPTGKVYSQNGPFPPKFAKAKQAWDARLKEPALSNVVEVEHPFTDPANLLPVAPDSLDAVMINMNYHDLVGRGVDTKAFNAAIFKWLKPGGAYCVVDNSAQNGSGARDVSTLHRIDEAYEVKEIEQAGFNLAAASDILRNPKDDRTWFIMKHRGEQDRFVLKFVKPAGA